ncbi:MAG: rod shape-determining protein MreD [Gammaproteobacteria bacterium]|nr:MAG: rod shape-determining protein MreD [Gammaproteobacteria bacterium]
MRIEARIWLVLLTSFLLALMLVMLPLPDWATPFRPEWLAMVLIYWCLAIPERVGIGIAWSLGLFLDVSSGAILGQYALSYATMAFFTLKLHQRIRVFPLWQQAMTVMFLIIMHQVIVLWVKGIIGQSINTLAYWLPSVVSMLLWPWLFLLLRNIRRHFRIA